MHTPRTLALIIVLGLAFTGCGTTEAEPEPQPTEHASQEQTDTPEPETTGYGTYQVHATSGTELEFQLPADTTNETIAEIDALREELGIEPVTYITADIDNRNGDTLAALPQISVFDEAGTEYEFQSLPYALPEWEPEFDSDNEDAYWEIYDQLSTLEEAHHDSVSPAGVGQTVLIYQSDDLPEEFTRVATYPNGVGQADDAYLAEDETSIEASDNDYLDYLSQDQRDTATDEQLASYNECMTMVATDFKAADMEFDGNDAHHNCITAIDGPNEYPDTSNVDWNYMREVSDCYDELVVDKPWILEDLPQEQILENPSIVLEHPEVQEHCM